MGALDGQQQRPTIIIGYSLVGYDLGRQRMAPTPAAAAAGGGGAGAASPMVLTEQGRLGVGRRPVGVSWIGQEHLLVTSPSQVVLYSVSSPFTP